MMHVDDEKLVAFEKLRTLLMESPDETLDRWKPLVTDLTTWQASEAEPVTEAESQESCRAKRSNG